jgi:hypothetical protein
MPVCTRLIPRERISITSFMVIHLSSPHPVVQLAQVLQPCQLMDKGLPGTLAGR